MNIYFSILRFLAVKGKKGIRMCCIVFMTETQAKCLGRRETG